MKTVIGIDYGTKSARALLVNAENGEVLCSHTVVYPHGVMDGSLASIDDYDNALTELLTAVTPSDYRQTVCAICVDATSCTLVCVDKAGRPLASRDEFRDREQAQVKLWKRHAADSQADEALALAKQRGESFLKRTGDTISSEWTLPKLLEIRDVDRAVYDEADLALDLCEYLTFCLTGTIVRSTGSLGFKGLCSEEGLPSADFLEALRPGLAAEYARLMRGPVFAPGERVGTLKTEWCDRLGLSPDVVVASGLIDGFTATAALGALRVGDAALVVGTSNVITVQLPTFAEVSGVCGIVKDGMVSGAYSLEGGQNCTGDMLEWYMDNALPADIRQQAIDNGVSPHHVLCERVREPWNNRVVVLDWFNGSRNVPCDLSLRSAVIGLSTETRPEDVYVALLQSIVCGTREVLEQCRACGVTIERVVATGGITQKNPLLMQQYAELLGMPVRVGEVEEGPAFGTALFAAVAAGMYADVNAAYEQMGVKRFTTYVPTPEHREAYESLFQKHHALRCLMTANRI